VIEIHPHALTHGQAEQDIVSALNSETGAIRQRDAHDVERWLLIGFNARGNLIQVIKIIREDGSILVIHAMKAQKMTIETIERARRGQI